MNIVKIKLNCNAIIALILMGNFYGMSNSK